MKDIILLGNEGRRKEYFLKAANEMGRNIIFLPLFSNEIFNIKNKENYSLKIDPPIYETGNYNDMDKEIEKYINYLKKLEQEKFNFLNRPVSLINTLDKFKMKEILLEENINTTEEIKLDIYNRESLFEKLKKEKISNIFIKPRYGSGAVGILALKYNFKKDDYSLFTSLVKGKDNYYNTKKLSYIRDRKIIFDLIDRILKDKPIIEKWVEKKRYDDKVFDIRVLVQFDDVKFMIGRMSDGPITNLHLNNQGIDIEELCIDKKILQEIKEISIKGVNSFKGLNCGGVDILLSKNDEVKIIEINGHGDLIYKDIFNENKIYKDQIERM